MKRTLFLLSLLLTLSAASARDAQYQVVIKTNIMGPWIHGQQAKSAHGQVDFGKDAAIAGELAWRLQWYDHWLKSLDNSVGKTAPLATKVRIFVMGTGDCRKTDKGLLHHGGFWREEKEWPPARGLRKAIASVWTSAAATSRVST